MNPHLNGQLIYKKDARIYNGEQTASSKNSAGKTGQLNVKNEIRTLPNTTTKINSKWIKDINVRPETIILRGKHSRTLNDINQSKILYDPLPRVMETK